MFLAIIGFLLGLGIGGGDARSRTARILTAFIESKGIRLPDRDGNEVSLEDLVAAARKR